jgi:hypothetical protein
MNQQDTSNVNMHRTAPSTQPPLHTCRRACNFWLSATLVCANMPLSARTGTHHHVPTDRSTISSLHQASRRAICLQVKRVHMGVVDQHCRVAPAPAAEGDSLCAICCWDIKVVQ